MKKCPFCGAIYGDDAQHCEKCDSPLTSLGRPLQVDEEVNETDTAQDTYDSPSTVKAESQESGDGPSTVLAGKASEKKPSKKSNKALVWTLVTLLVLGALGGGGYYLYSQGMLDDIFGTHHKKTAIDDEDDEDEDDEYEYDEEDNDLDDDEDYGKFDNEDYDEEVNENETAAIENIEVEEPIIRDEPVTPAPREEAPAPRQETPAPRQQTPEPRQQTPTPRQETPTPRQETPTPRQQTPAQPVQQGTQTTPRTNVNPTPPQPSVTLVTVTSNIPRAMIIIDGVDVGWAPWSGELSPGMHTFALKAKNKEKLRTSDFSVNVTGRSMTVPINVPNPSVFE